MVPDIKDSKNAKKMEHVKGAISFDHVSFEYPDDHVPVLEDINITVRPGERIALVGPSGGGKTTMCNLLPRFYAVSYTHLDVYKRQWLTRTRKKAVRLPAAILWWGWKVKLSSASL